MTTLKFIDPADCGCTDCQTGVALSLQHVTQRTIAQLVTGELCARFDAEATINITVTLAPSVLALLRPDGCLRYGVTNLLAEVQRWNGELRLDVREV